MSSGKKNPMSGKLVTGNDGNFMLLLDPLSEDKAVFTSIRYTSDSDLSPTTGSDDCPTIVETIEKDARTTELDATLNFRKQGTKRCATFLPSQQTNTETGFNLQPLTGSFKTKMIYTPSLSTCSSSAVTVVPALSRQSTNTFAIPSNGLSNNVQPACSKLTPNTCFINTDQKLQFQTHTPLIIIPSSKESQTASSSAPTVSMQANKSINSCQPQCLLTASTMLQSIAMTGNCIPHFTKQPTILDTSSNHISSLGKNESSQEKTQQNHTSVQDTTQNMPERNIQIIYPSTLSSSKRGQPNKFFMPQTSVTLTGPSAVSAKVFSPSTAVTVNASNGNTKCVPVTMLSTVSSQPQIKQMVSSCSDNSDVVPQNSVVLSGSKSILKNQIPSASPVVTSYVAPPGGNTILIAPSPQASNAEQFMFNFRTPVIVKLPSINTIGDFGRKSKYRVTEFMTNEPKKVKTLGKETLATKSQGKQTLVTQLQGKETLTSKSQGQEIQTTSSGYVPYKQQMNNPLITNNLPPTTSSVKTHALPLKIHNVFSLANDVEHVTTCQEKVTEPKHLNTNHKNKSEVVCSTRLADTIYPCYPVLEKLSDKQIAHIMSSIAEEKRGKCRRKLRSRNRPSDSDIILERKCSSYCRQRTLNFLCGLGMLNCEKLKSYDPCKTTKLTQDAKKQSEDKRLQSVSVSVHDKSNLQNPSVVQNTSSKTTTLEKTGVKVSKVVQPELKSNTIPIDPKRVPMQLIMMNNKLFLLPMTGNSGTLLMPRILGTPLVMPAPVLTNLSATAVPSELRYRLAAGVQQRISDGGAQGNAPSFLNQPITCAPGILKKNRSASIPTFRPTFMTAAPPVSKTSSLSSATVRLAQPSVKKGAPNGSRAAPIIIQTPAGQQTLFLNKTQTVPIASKTPASSNIDDIPKETKTTGKKVDPWKLPWNYEIKSEPVTEGYGDEESSQKSGQTKENTTDHVMTVRLPFQNPTSTVPSAPITWVPRAEPSGNTLNNANTCSPYQSVAQPFSQSKIAKTGTDLLVESSQSSRIQRLKEILREKEQMLEDLKRKKASSLD